MPLGTTRGFTVVASIATWDATGESMGDSGGVISFFCHLGVEATTLASTPSLFLEDAPPRVFTVLRLLQREKETEKRKGLPLKSQR